MNDTNDTDAIKELKRIEKETRVLELLSDRLDSMEQKMQELTNNSEHPSVDQSSVQDLITKMTALRILIDRIEIEIGHLDARITDVESLRFKRRTGG